MGETLAFFFMLTQKNFVEKNFVYKKLYLDSCVSLTNIGNRALVCMKNNIY